MSRQSPLRIPWVIGVILAVLCVAAGVSTVASAATPAPDVSIMVSGPSAVGINAPFTEKAVVTNRGTTTTPGISVSYSTGGTAISPTSAPAGMYCTYVEMGHSGRGGGSTIVGDTCWETLAGGLAPGKSTTVALIMTEGHVLTLALTFVASPYPTTSQLNQVSHTAVTSVSVVDPPRAAAPTGVSATQSGDQLNVSWTPAPATAPYISASAIVAAPLGGSSAPVLTGSASGATTHGVVPGVLASTTYSVTVANNDGGGLGAISQPFVITAKPATVPPGKPTITYYWGYADIRWNPPSAGNSVIDQYEVSATDGGQALTSYVSGTTLADYLAPQPADLLTVEVRAHNLAGWGAWSAPVYFSDGGGG